MQKIKKLDIYTDGGSRGNPGPAAIGVHAVISKNSPAENFSSDSSRSQAKISSEVESNRNIVFQLSEYIGKTTNNVAEWQALIKALEYLIINNIKVDQLDFYLDSQLVVKQITFVYKIKQPHLQKLSSLAQKLLQRLNSTNTHFHYIPREQNKIADSLVNQALDHLAA